MTCRIILIVPTPLTCGMIIRKMLHLCDIFMSRGTHKVCSMTNMQPKGNISASVLQGQKYFPLWLARIQTRLHHAHDSSLRVQLTYVTVKLYLAIKTEREQCLQFASTAPSIFRYLKVAIWYRNILGIIL